MRECICVGGLLDAAAVSFDLPRISPPIYSETSGNKFIWGQVVQSNGTDENQVGS